MQVQAIYLKDGYSPVGKNARGLDGWYRDLSCEEAKRFGYHNTLYAVDRHGNVRECRVNGSAKVWKRSPGCELSLRYGLKENFRVGDKERNPHDAISDPWQVRIVVPVKAGFKPDDPASIVTDFVVEHEVGR